MLGDRRYEPCSVDFGQARLVEDGSGASFSIKSESVGSFGYMTSDTTNYFASKIKLSRTTNAVADRLGAALRGQAPGELHHVIALVECRSLLLCDLQFCIMLLGLVRDCRVLQFVGQTG
ncbi:hypothetical protein V6N11_067954 [Hibiscus sabdariffa]|uniref:Protein kinase domain-containing protein n=1 Tax=Hibiscus sabdariffa TaxID=183260 RepID=A0ABR2SSN7_9ROSI